MTWVGGLAVAFCSVYATCGELPLPQKWDTVYVWFLVTNPEYSPSSGEAERALTSAHIQYQLRLQESGQAIAAGGLGEGPVESVIGMTILRADNPAAGP